MTYFEFIPQEIKDLPQWVNAFSTSKVPMQSNVMKGASASKPETWATFKDAKDSVEVGNYDNLGFVFNDNGLVGIDIDAGFNEDGSLSDICSDIMEHCKSYTELSRSGRGVHILVKGELPFKGKNNQNGVEIYKSGRYFLVTGDVLRYTDIVANQEAIDYIVEKYFADAEEIITDFHRKNIYQPVYAKPRKGHVQITPTYPPIGEGSRNLALTSLGGQLHSVGYSRKEIYQILTKVNEIACDPKLPTREIEQITISVSKYKR